MAKKITELTAFTAAASGDLLVMVDDPTGSAETKKITAGDLLTSPTDERLLEWAAAEAYTMTAVTRNGDGVITGADVVWLDGSAGVFTATTVNATWKAVDAYTVTHTVSGKTITQAAVTRSGGGEVTAVPALTIA